MVAHFWEISLILTSLLTIGLHGKTLRYKIITDDEGHREIIPSQNATKVPSDIIQFLENDLNLTQPTSSTTFKPKIKPDEKLAFNNIMTPPPKSYTSSPHHELKMWTPNEGWKMATTYDKHINDKQYLNDRMDVFDKITPTADSLVEEHTNTDTSTVPTELNDPTEADFVYKMNPTTRSYIEKHYHFTKHGDEARSTAEPPDSDVPEDSEESIVYKINPTTKSYIDQRYKSYKNGNAIAAESTTQSAIPDEEIVYKMNPTTKSYLDNHSQLMKKWNAYTAEGWSRQKNAIYANSTKLVIFDDGSRNKTAYKQGRSENITFADDSNDLNDVSISSNDYLRSAAVVVNDSDATVNISDDSLIEKKADEISNDLSFWDLLTRLYDCFENDSKHNGTFSCIQTRMTNIVLTFLGGSFKNLQRRSQEKTLMHGKRILKGALLPLLVLLIIKYLIALPVLLAGIVTIKTFWLSLLSAGVASFGAPWKKHVLKRAEPEVAWASSSPPWMAMDGYSKGTEQYYM